MKRKGLLVLLIAVAISLFTLTGCEKTDFTVGVCQLATHDALDEATRGFKEALESEMEKAGKTIKIDIENAQGEPNNCTTIVSTFVANKYDLIMANATPALQAAYNKTATIPILGTSITTYNAALNLTLNSDGSTGKNVSGTSDLADLEEQAAMIKEWIPDCTSIGIIYCSSEANSIYQVEKMEEYLENLGVSVARYSFSDQNDIRVVCASAVGVVNAIYVPTDNTCAECKEIIGKVFKDELIPVFSGEASLCDVCSVASISISYYGIGYKCGLMAAEILLEGKDVSTLPIGYDQEPVKKYNSELANLLGLTVPAGYTEIGE